MMPSLEIWSLCSYLNLCKSKAKCSDDTWAKITKDGIVPEVFTQTLASVSTTDESVLSDLRTCV